MSSVVNPWKTFFTYPPTWLAGAVIVGLHVAFSAVVQPTLLWTLAAFGADLAAAAGWLVLAFKSEAFRARLNRMPYENDGKETASLLGECPERFRRPALESVGLIGKINAEFPDRAYSAELDLMLMNIRELAKNHKTLWTRSQSFGNAAQRKEMEQILENQTATIASTLATLKTFSGNLTLLEADAAQTGNAVGLRNAAGALKDLNSGLKEVLDDGGFTA
ncbi:MAG: hypothetical protein JXD23_01895 [Spirochaetales bacterium]|nr:hypothetical protein [Spirochaetales bacterium]